MPQPLIDKFYEVIAEQLLPELQDLDADTAGIRHWLVIEDSDGIAITEVDEEVEPGHALQSHAQQGANAAYATYTPGPPSEHVLAYVVMANRVNSDIRRSYMTRVGGSVSLGPWEYTV